MANFEKESDHGIFTLLVMAFFTIILFIYFYRKKQEYYKVALFFLVFLLFLNIRGCFWHFILRNNYIYVEGKVTKFIREGKSKGIDYEYIYDNKTYKGQCSFPYYIEKENLYLDYKYFQVRVGTNFPSISQMDFYKPISK